MHTASPCVRADRRHPKDNRMGNESSVVIAGPDAGINCRAVLVKIPGQAQEMSREVFQRIRLFFSVPNLRAASNARMLLDDRPGRSW